MHARSISGRFRLAALATLVAGWAGLFQPAAIGAQTTVQASAADMLALAERFAGKGEIGKAERILQLLTRDPRAEVRNEARSRLAILYEKLGRDRDAAVLLRAILDEQPDAAAVRIRLALLLQKMGDEEAAHRELRAVRVTDLPPNVARFVDRLAAAAQAHKPLSFQVELALAPDSNINRATRSDTIGTVIGDFEIDEGEKSGIGVAGRGYAQWRLKLGDHLSLVSRALGDARLYRDSQFDDITAGLSTGPEWQVGTTTLSAEVGASQQWFGNDKFQRSWRLAGTVVQPVDRVSQVRIDVARRWVNDQVNDLRDGSGVSLLARYERALSPRLAIVATGALDRFSAEDAAYSTWSWSAGIAAYREVGRMTWNAGVDYGSLESDERLQLFPHKRDDRLVRLQVGSVFRQFTFAGFAPVARLIYERNKSTVEFYDYRRLRTEFGISRAF